MQVIFTGLRALAYGIVFVALWTWLALTIRIYDKYLPISLPAWTRIPGIILVSLGGSLALLCLSKFVLQGRGTGAPFDPPRVFVAAGPYRYVRNPMYIGGGMMFVGLGLYEQSISILIFSLIWLLLAHCFVLFIEEPGLEKRFGESYGEYKKSINRWIPGWPWKPFDHLQI
jgi:protein-S-isoprenylcysteine O-methyltransferase Ste14